MLAKTFKGLEEVLAREFIALGANNVQIGRRSVSFTGDKAMLYRANFCLRTALRILVPIMGERLAVRGERKKPEDQLYEAVKAIDWSQYMTADTTFAIDATVYSECFRNSRFVTYSPWPSGVEKKRDLLKLPMYLPAPVLTSAAPDIT